ncbi:DUF3541 domain-containing protein [Photobacterium sp. GB-36]|uniref:DUF3541 domain-containing protein n=1 Tax=Photobacterium sp. GB-36 TaxID=2022108 RepID=UPI000D179CF1|nr:DUF3541 domain-containing protein [Photobacterium sp. GB-36]PSV47169.1 DUF3541 domain-containing protein [Photobacterium sp. GB-36]
MRLVLSRYWFFCLLFCWSVAANSLQLNPTYQQSANQIRQTFEPQLYTLPAYTAGHYGLRMYRQSLDPKYAAAIWQDMARVASNLNRYSTEVVTPEQVQRYSLARLANYKTSPKERSQRRYKATQTMPEYLYLGVGLLGSMARADEYGLKHQNDAQLRQVLRRYDFKKYVTDPEMIQAWAAQLANQVYWLRQLGEQDVVNDFIIAFRETYPDSQDNQLSSLQYSNKIYGLTHIIFAASKYYQLPIHEKDHQWIFDYYRKNIDKIIAETKEDVIAEVGINFLLAGLEADPVVEKTRKVIQQAINPQHGMIPSVTGDIDLVSGEHRNVLAIMLLDWKETHLAPTLSDHPQMFKHIPYGLIAK